MHVVLRGMWRHHQEQPSGTQGTMNYTCLANSSTFPPTPTPRPRRLPRRLALPRPLLFRCENSGSTRDKGGVLATKGSGKHKAKAMS